MNSDKNSIFDYNSDDVRSGAVELPCKEDAPSGEKPENKKKTGRLLYFLIVGAISLALSAVLITGMVNRLNDGLVMALQAGDIYPMQMEDGQYSGTFASGNMSATVTVEISSGCITDISLNSFKGIDTARAQRVFSAVLVAQTLDTGLEDVGSEPTDRILLKAIEDAFSEDEGQ